MTPPLVAFLCTPERLEELEMLWLDTRGLLTALSTCRALRTEHQWRTDVICQVDEWRRFNDVAIMQAAELRRTVAWVLDGPGQLIVCPRHRPFVGAWRG